MSETRLRPRDPQYLSRVQSIWDDAHFIKEVGYELSSIEAGRCVTTLVIQKRHMQQNNFVHAGVLATMADHTAGAAAGSLVARDQVVLTLEFKINLLRPAVGETLVCRSEVLKNGKTVIVSESEVFVVKKGREKLAAKAMVSLAVVGSSYR